MSAFKSPDSLKLSQLIRYKNTYPSLQLADSFAPNSTGFPAFPLTMGRMCGWLKLTPTVRYTLFFIFK